jgi:hypothetical protein
MESMQLDPPKFTFDEENGDLEVWSFRLPVFLSVDALQGVKFDPSTGSTTFAAPDGKEYRIQAGDAAATDSFRVLVPKKKGSGEDDDKSSSSSSSNSDDGDDDDEEEDTYGATKKAPLRPCKMAFSKHFQVLASVPVLTESQLAPQEGPPPADKTMRHAYAPVAQRTGLKRRWMPIGVARVDQDADASKPKKRTVAAQKQKVVSKEEGEDSAVKMEIDSSPSKRIKREQGDSDDSDASSSSPGDEKLSKSERKAKKAEKKALKKAKKESKKAKKAAKKAKKEKSKS